VEGHRDTVETSKQESTTLGRTYKSVRAVKVPSSQLGIVVPRGLLDRDLQVKAHNLELLPVLLRSHLSFALAICTEWMQALQTSISKLCHDKHPRVSKGSFETGTYKTLSFLRAFSSEATPLKLLFATFTSVRVFAKAAKDFGTVPLRALSFSVL
jgi:hypothetical protein